MADGHDTYNSGREDPLVELHGIPAVEGVHIDLAVPNIQEIAENDVAEVDSGHEDEEGDVHELPIQPQPVPDAPAMFPPEVISRAQLESSRARGAATMLRRLIVSINEAIEVGRTRVSKARKKSESVAEPTEADHYSGVAQEFEEAIELASTRALEARAAANDAEVAATNAIEATAPLFNLNREHANIVQDMQICAAAAVNAKDKSIAAMKAEYAGLKAIQKCYAEIDDADFSGVPVNPNRRSASAYGKFCDSGKDRSVSKIVVAVFLVLGIAVLGVIPVWKPKSDSYWALLSLGIFMTASALAVIIYWIVMHGRAKRKASRMERNRRVIRETHNRRSELDDYFRDNNIPNEHAEDP